MSGRSGLNNFKALFVVPTRNRAGLAMAAINSLLARTDARIQVWVSDNSTEADTMKTLHDFCAASDDPRLFYIRPPEPLPMGQHWNWILDRALADQSISHVGFLTDRMLFMPGAMRMLLDLAARRPGQLITYPNDHIEDLHQPVRLHQHQWTGRVVQIDSGRVVDIMRRSGWTKVLPRVLNNLVPREVFEKIADHYGNVVASTAPDVCFGFRALERLDSMLYLDRPMIVDYAIASSNGHSAARGAQTSAFVDFQRQVDSRGMTFAAPLPGFTGTANVCLHEYNLVHQQSDSPKFPRLNVVTAHHVAAGGLDAIEDPTHRAEVTERFARRRKELIVAGEWWSALPSALLDKLTLKASPAYLWRKLVKTFSKRIPDYEGGFWCVLRRIGIQPYAVIDQITEWPDRAQALDMVLHHPLPALRCRSEMEYTMAARLIEIAA